MRTGGNLLGTVLLNFKITRGSRLRFPPTLKGFIPSGYLRKYLSKPERQVFVYSYFFTGKWMYERE